MNPVLSPDDEARQFALRSIQPGVSITSLFSSLNGVDPLELRILLGYALNLSRVQLITQSERNLNMDEANQLRDLLLRRMKGEPIAYLIGEREFYGLPFYVNPAVLIPRPETELLVELAVERLPEKGRVLDMGTGSGAVAIAIAHTRPDAVVTAVDLSLESLEVARKNVQRNLQSETQISFLEGNWYEALKENALYDMIVSNPPYIAVEDAHLHQGDLRFEPAQALTDDGDGLSALRILVEGAPECLKSGGWLLMEHGYDQAEAVRAMLLEKKFNQVQSWRDLAGIERVSGARKP